MSKPEHDYMFKLILVGSSGVGKSNILLRFTRNQFNQNHQTTIGVEYATRNLTVNGKVLKLQIWDTMGQEQYKSIMKTFYKGASAVILTYDITSEKSYEDLDYWYKQIKDYGKNQVVVMLVGNKSDWQEERKISKQKGLQYAQKNKIAFYQVSAKQGTNVELIFTKIAEQLQKIMSESEKSKKQTIIAQQNKTDGTKTVTQNSKAQKDQSPIKLKADNHNTNTQNKNKICC